MSLRRTLVLLAAALLLLLPFAPQARAEVSELRLAYQYGLSYLPLIVAQQQKLIEKHAAAAGLPELRLDFVRLSGGAAVNDALLSGSIDVGSGGLGPLLTIWDKTRGSLDVRAIAALDRVAIPLNTNQPRIRTLADITPADRIAVPAVKVSIQSVLLQIAAEQAFGPGRQGALDDRTVSLKHADAVASLLSGSGDVTLHFTQQPFGLQELRDPRIHTVLTSADILGGPATLNAVYTTARFRAANPRVTGAILAALREADAFIAAHPAEAARLYLEVEKTQGVDAGEIETLITDPRLGGYQVAPFGVTRLAAFLHRVGALANPVGSWKDLFFSDLHQESGS